MEALKTEESQRLCAEVIEMLRHTAKRIQERTKNIADYIKLSHAPVAFAPCRLAEVVDNVLKILRLPADVKHVALRAEGLDRLPVIQADELRLYAVFYNLINNAIPEVPPGGSVTVGGTAAGDAVTLTVSDTGRGMPPEVREKLFTSRSASRKAGGSGIGMQIVKDAVDSHGGEIRVESAEGKGTTFTIRLPLAPAG
jgi:signal transduction histidine kinase